MAKNDDDIRKLKPKVKNGKTIYPVLSFGNGLILVLRKNGSKTFLFKYRWKGDDDLTKKEKRINIGVYQSQLDGEPLTLKKAKSIAYEYYQKVKNGENPAIEREAKIELKKRQQAMTLEVFYPEWFDVWKKGKSKDYTRDNQLVMNRVVQSIGHHPLVNIDLPLCTTLLKNTYDSRGAHVTNYVLRNMQKLLMYAVMCGHLDDSPLRGIKLSDLYISKPPTTSQKIINIDELGDIHLYFDNMLAQGKMKPVTRLALSFVAHTMLRSIEVRRLKWEYIDREKGTITFPASDMKMNREHILYITKQVGQILDKLQEVTGKNTGICFVGNSGGGLSQDTLIAKLRASKFEGTIHGYRSCASTFLNKTRKFNRDAIELNLAHFSKSIHTTYNHDDYWSERKEIYQYWSDTIEELEHQALPEWLKKTTQDDKIQKNTIFYLPKQIT